MIPDHPRYLEHITLLDGRTGTVVDVYANGAAFLIELDGATGWRGLIVAHEEDFDLNAI